MSSTGQRFGGLVLARRNELELSQVEVSDAGGPSNTWLTLIENGRLESLSRVTARKLDTGLKWEPGSARRAWNGGEPTPLLDESFHPDSSATLRHYIEHADLKPEIRARLLAVLDEPA